MFEIFDEFLKKINIDLFLTPYKVLACSKDDGFLQLVPKSETI
jgi:phosphatidylinositol 3-kinase